MDRSSKEQGRPGSVRAYAVAISVLAVLCTASVSLNVYLFQRVMAEYRRNQLLRLDPVGAEESARQHLEPDSKSETKERRVVFFGDSRVRMWPTGKIISTYRVFNRGVPGETTAQAIHRLEQDVFDLHPDLVVIQTGVNDLKAIGVLESRYEEIVSATQRNLARIVRELRSHGVRVVLVQILPVGRLEPYRHLVWSKEINRAIEEVNRFLRTLQGPGITVMECPAELVDADGRIKSVYALDALHLNRSGYRILNEAVGRVL